MLLAVLNLGRVFYGRIAAECGIYNELRPQNSRETGSDQRSADIENAVLGPTALRA